MTNTNDVHVSPNIQSDSDIYEIENIACDPNNLIEKFFEEKFDWKNKNVLDIGCGTGFHLPYFAKTASHVFGVEPHDDSRKKTESRALNLKNVSVIKGSAENLNIESNSIDFAYSRFAYFWGPGCEKGIEEVFRTLKPGGSFVMIDNNLESGTFGTWVKRLFNSPDSKQKEVDQFWSDQGFKLKTIGSEWIFKTREDLENVLKIEFSKELAKELIAEHSGLSIDYTFNLYFKTKS